MRAPEAPCVSCDRIVRASDPGGALAEVVGWDQIVKRKGGGSHHWEFPFFTGRVMCERCAGTRRVTGNAGQGSLV